MRDYAELVKALRTCKMSIPCTECPFYSNGDEPSKECATMNVAAADAIEELLDELTTIRKQLPHWISVEERLPKTDHEVLVCCVNSFYPEDRWVHVDWVEENGKWSQHDIVTHWMPKPPLPAQPKGVE